MIKLKSILSNWLVILANAIVVFFLSPYVVQHLGDVSYGVWVFINSLTGYMGVLSLGLLPTINRYVASFHAKGDRKTLNVFLSSSRFILSISGLLSLGIGLMIALYIPKIIKGIGYDVASVRWAVVLITLQIVGGFLFTMYEGILVGLQRFETSNAVQLIGLLIRSAMIFLFLKHGYGIVALAGATLASYGVEWMLMRHYSYAYLPTLSISARNASRDLVKTALNFSVYIFIITIAGRISLQTDSLVIGYNLSAEWITYFAIAANLVNIGIQLQWGLYMVVFPASSSLHAVGDADGLRELHERGTRYSLMLLVPIFVAFFVVGGDFIKLWMGSKYSALSGEILAILSIGHIVNLSQSISTSVLLSMGFQKLVAVIVSGQAVVNILLSIYLVRFMGLQGVAWGTTVPMLIGPVLISILITRKMCIGYFSYIKRTYLSVIPSAIVLSVAFFAYARYIAISSWLMFIVCIGSGVAAYGVALRYTYLDSAEVAYLARLSSSFWKTVHSTQQR